jgi:uncharacterized membrane protein YeaQ/YmgE (transglycosylase-associated protein family)
VAAPLRAGTVEDATGFNLWSLFVAVVGSAVVLMLYHAFTRGPHSPA